LSSLKEALFLGKIFTSFLWKNHPKNELKKEQKLGKNMKPEDSDTQNNNNNNKKNFLLL